MASGLIALAGPAACGAAGDAPVAGIGARVEVPGGAPDPAWAASVSYEFVGGRFAGLAAMRDAADVVAVGRFVPTGEIATVHGDALEDVVSEPVGSFQIEELLAGSPAPGRVRVTLPTSVEQAASIPQDRVLAFFLRRDDHTQSYRVIEKFGLWAATTRAALDAPIAEEAPADPGPFHGELRDRGLRTLDELIGYVRSLRALAD